MRRRFKLAAVPLLAFLLGACADDRPVLHVLTWPNYFAPSTIADFEKEHGCRVRLDMFESSETLRTKLGSGASGYDVVFPSDEVLPQLIALGAIEKLDAAKVPNRRHLDPRFLAPAADAENAYSLPYMWGATGIAYHKDKVQPAPESWAALLDPRFREGVTLLDDAREVFAALSRLDPSAPGILDAETLARAEKRFDAWKPKAYESAPKDMLIQGDAWICQAYSGDALQASEELQGKIGFVIPKEGGTLWFDSLAIAKGAPQRDLAHRFIDYLLRPEVSAAITNATRFANPNAAARAFIAKEILDDPRVHPPEADLRRLALLPVLGPELKRRLDDAWARVRAR
jgi:spermidine/putrescine-binding protein